MVAMGIVVRIGWIWLSVKVMDEMLDRPAFDFKVGDPLRQKKGLARGKSGLDPEDLRLSRTSYEDVLRQLLLLGKEEPEGGSSPYLENGQDTPRGWELISRSLGRALHRLGGRELDLMRAALAHVQAELGRKAADSLSLAWHGIGAEEAAADRGASWTHEPRSNRDESGE